jgi:cytochrome oxidase assembly protein ShyY1
VENKSFALIVLTLVVLIVLALWQFYSLAWGDSLSLSYHVRSPTVAAAPQ